MVRIITHLRHRNRMQRLTSPVLDKQSCASQSASIATKIAASNVNSCTNCETLHEQHGVMKIFVYHFDNGVMSTPVQYIHKVFLS